MLNFTLILIFFSQLTFAEKLSIDQKRSKILAIVDEELSENSIVTFGDVD
jgi:hypothetical protein